MRSAALLVLVLALCRPLSAEPLPLPVEVPSSVTGDYVGGGWACRFVAELQKDERRGILLRCTLPTNAQATSVSTSVQCPDEWLLLPVTEQDQRVRVWLRVIGVDHGVSLTLKVGAYDELMLGGGQFLTMYLAQPLVPGRPYQGCGATARGRR